MPRKKPTYEQITQTLESDRGLSIKDRALFHAFNPNGAYETKKKADRLIDDAVARGIMKSGAIVAYGGLNTYGEDRLMECVCVNRPYRHKVDYSIKWLKEAVEKIHERIAEASADG